MILIKVIRHLEIFFFNSDFQNIVAKQQVGWIHMSEDFSWAAKRGVNPLEQKIWLIVLPHFKGQKAQHFNKICSDIFKFKKIKIKIEISYQWFKKIDIFQYLKEITTNAEPIKPTLICCYCQLSFWAASKKKHTF